MRRIVLLLAILIIAGCGGAKKKEQKVSGAVEELVPVKDSLINPAGGLFATDYKYVFFGEIGYRDRTFREDTLLFPPIPNLAHKSVYVKCPKDTCFAEYAVLALRCPPIEPLLNWLSDTVSVFANNCPIGHGLTEFSEASYEIPTKHLKSDKEICDYYMGRLQHVYDVWHCSGETEHDVLNEQAGLLIADCWNICDLYTFYRIDWYDHLCGGNNSRESFWTVDATTGKQLTLADIVKPEMRDSLAALMVQRLVNGHGEYYIRQYECTPNEYINVLNGTNGCALIEEGLMIYFYPYNLGSGADGEYEAVIPYEELDGILALPLSLLLVPLHEYELDITTYETTAF